MSHNHFEDLSNKLARDIDSDRKIDGAMLLKHELDSNPQQALAIIRQEQARELRNGSCERLEIKQNGEIFITNYRPASGIHSEGVYVGMYPGVPEPPPQSQLYPPQQRVEAPPPPPPPQSYAREPVYEQPLPPPTQPNDQAYVPQPYAPIQQQFLPPPPPQQMYDAPPQYYAPPPPPGWYQPQPSVSLWLGGGGGWHHPHYWHRR